MSSFNFPATNKASGEVVRVDGLDDYFGRHQYGYRPEGSDRVFTEDEFYEAFEELRRGVTSDGK